MPLTEPRVAGREASGPAVVMVVEAGSTFPPKGNPESFSSRRVSAGSLISPP